MGSWPTTKARRVLAALRGIGWPVKRRSGGSHHRVRARSGWPDDVWAFHDGVEIDPKMLARIAKSTGPAPDDLSAPRPPFVHYSQIWL